MGRRGGNFLHAPPPPPPPAPLMTIFLPMKCTDMASLTLAGDEDGEDRKEFVRKFQGNESISRKHAHSVFVGPPGSGKSSLMAKLLRRKMSIFSSTGVSNPVVIVDIDVANPSTFCSVKVMDGNTWKEVKFDESLVSQMHETTPAPAAAEPMLPEESPSISKSEKSDSKPTHSSNSGFITVQAVAASLSVDINKIFDSIREKYGSFKKLKGSSSLYLRDTGGQVEFQESISLVIFGPSIFFFVFRADIMFQSKFSIEYRTSESTNCYTSSITVEEALLQCLASVYAMDTPSHIETPKPLVYIVGTHVDNLGSSAEKKISELDEHLDSLIQSNGFGHLVQYADSDNRQVMFAVDNTSDSDEKFELIRSNVNSLISGREEFTIDFPMRYLLFCLELQNLKLSVIPLDKFKAMAAKYGIVQDHEVSRLLQFLHVRVGVIQYFDKDGLRHIVIKEPQILFNKASHQHHCQNFFF